jgi:hypothetical protein
MPAMLRKRVIWLCTVIIGGVVWIVQTGGDLQFAVEAFKHRGKAVSWIGVVIASPFSGATAVGLGVLGLVGPWAYDKWWPKPARIRVGLQPGTARMGPYGLTHKPAADLLVTNDGPPINLIAKARLTNVSPGFTWAAQDVWEYSSRVLLSGPSSSTWFHIATIQIDPPTPNQWVVAVRAEHMVVVRRWVLSPRSDLWFDVQFDFYYEAESTLHFIQSVGVHVSASDDRTGFVMNLRP